MRIPNVTRRCLVRVACALLFGCAVAAKAGEGGPPKPDDSFDKEPRLKFEDGGRRDPFTFMKAVVAPAGPDGGSKYEPTPQDILIQKREESEKFYSLAERAVKAYKLVDSLALCDKGLESLKDVQSDVPEVQILRERLFRLKKAVERMKNRADAEQTFKGMGIKVTGVVAMERESLAIINSKVVSKGELIETADANELPPRVDDIQPGRVIFNFRGYKIELRISQ